MKTHHLLQEDEVVLDAGTPELQPLSPHRRTRFTHAIAAWCKTVLENAPVLGQLVITSAAILFLAKGKEAVPGLVVPLEQVAEINLGADSLPQIAQPNQGLRTTLAIGYMPYLPWQAFPHLHKWQKPLR